MTAGSGNGNALLSLLKQAREAVQRCDVGSHAVPYRMTEVALRSADPGYQAMSCVSERQLKQCLTAKT